MRAKNGKSYRANWFPRTESFQEVFIAWLEDLSRLGFKDQDGVFPSAKDLKFRLASAALWAQRAETGP